MSARQNDTTRSRTNGRDEEHDALGDVYLARDFEQGSEIMATNADLIEAVKAEAKETREMVRALVAAGTNGKNGNGRKPSWVAYGALVVGATGLFATAGSYVSSGSLWAGGTTGKVQQLQKELDAEVIERKTLDTWFRKTTQNFALHGWLVDDQGNVTKIQQEVQNARSKR